MSTSVQPNCPDCDGTGVQDDGALEESDYVGGPCPACRGTGAGPIHHLKLAIDSGSLVTTFVCPYDPADQTRPCWPREGEDGEGPPSPPDADGKSFCNWKEWWDWAGLDGAADDPDWGTVNVEDVDWLPEKCLYFHLGKVSPK